MRGTRVHEFDQRTDRGGHTSKFVASAFPDPSKAKWLECLIRDARIACQGIQNATLNDPIFNTRNYDGSDFAGLALLADRNALSGRELEGAMIYTRSD